MLSPLGYLEHLSFPVSTLSTRRRSAPLQCPFFIFVFGKSNFPIRSRERSVQLHKLSFSLFNCAIVFPPLIHNVASISLEMVSTASQDSGPGRTYSATGLYPLACASHRENATSPNIVVVATPIQPTLGTCAASTRPCGHEYQG